MIKNGLGKVGTASSAPASAPAPAAKAEKKEEKKEEKKPAKKEKEPEPVADDDDFGGAGDLFGDFWSHRYLNRRNVLSIEICQRILDIVNMRIYIISVLKVNFRLIQ